MEESFILKHELDHDVYRTIALHENPKFICPLLPNGMNIDALPQGTIAKAVDITEHGHHPVVDKGDVLGASLRNDSLAHAAADNSQVPSTAFSDWLATTPSPDRRSGTFKVDLAEVEDAVHNVKDVVALAAKAARDADASAQEAQRAFDSADKPRNAYAKAQLKLAKDASKAANAIKAQVDVAAKAVEEAKLNVQVARKILDENSDENRAVAQRNLTMARLDEGFAAMGLLHQSKSKSAKPRFRNGYMCLKLAPIDLTTTDAKDWRFVEDNQPDGHRTLLPIADTQAELGPLGIKKCYKFEVLEKLPWELHCMLISASAEPRPLCNTRDDETLATAIVVDKALEYLDYEDTMVSLRVLSKLRAADYTTLSYFSDDLDFLEEAEHVIDTVLEVCDFDDHAVLHNALKAINEIKA